MTAEERIASLGSFHHKTLIGLLFGLFTRPLDCCPHLRQSQLLEDLIHVLRRPMALMGSAPFPVIAGCASNCDDSIRSSCTPYSRPPSRLYKPKSWLGRNRDLRCQVYPCLLDEGKQPVPIRQRAHRMRNEISSSKESRKGRQ
jgi:hypothetical protein